MGQDHISNTIFTGNTAAVGGALRLGGKSFLDNCSFVDNRSDEGKGPAVDNIGFVGSITDSSFISNVFNCQEGLFLDANEVRKGLSRNAGIYANPCAHPALCSGLADTTQDGMNHTHKLGTNRIALPVTIIGTLTYRPW